MAVEFCEDGYNPNDEHCQSDCPADREACKAWTLKTRGFVPELITPDPEIVEEKPEPLDMENATIEILDRLSVQEGVISRLAREVREINRNYNELIKFFRETMEEKSNDG